MQRPVVAGGTPIHDVYLLIVRDRPFQIGEKFPVSYYKLVSVPEGGLVGIDPIPLEIVYSGKQRESFKVKDQGGVPTLIADTTIPHVFMGQAAPDLMFFFEFFLEPTGDGR